MTEIKSLPGLRKIFRRFVLKFARIAAWLNQKLEEDQSSHFGGLNETEIEALETPQHGLPSTPILLLPRPNKRCMLDPDACENQIGCFLLQKQPKGPAKKVVYWSRLLKTYGKACYTRHREGLSVVLAALLLRPYLKISCKTTTS